MLGPCQITRKAMIDSRRRKKSQKPTKSPEKEGMGLKEFRNHILQEQVEELMYIAGRVGVGGIGSGEEVRMDLTASLKCRKDYFIERP